MSRKIIVRQQIIVERVVPGGDGDGGSAFHQAEFEFDRLLEPVLEELRELGLSALPIHAETFVKEGDE